MHQKVILVELTVPWEEGCEEAYERNAPKYQHLSQIKAGRRGCSPMTIWCRGFICIKVGMELLLLAWMTGVGSKQLVDWGEEAERALCWLWSSTLS